MNKKVMKSPEKIFLQEPTKVRTEKLYDNDVEYIRADAFIEKACELLERMICEVTYEDLEGNSVLHYDKMEFIEDFKNYMKGE